MKPPPQGPDMLVPSPQRPASTTRILVFWLLILSIPACTTIRVETDWDRQAPLASLATFAWEEPPEPPQSVNPFADNSLLRKRVRQAAEQALQSRGFRLVPAEEAEFLVTFVVTLEERLRATGSHSGYWGHRPRYGGYVYSRTDVRSFQDGTLVIDIVDPDSRNLLWRGWARGLVPTADRNRDRIHEGVRRILRKFPPGGGNPGDR